MPMRLRPIFLLAAAMVLLAAGCSAPSLPFARLAGLVMNRQLDEISGLAASHAHDDVLWAHNDSGNPARLSAYGPMMQGPDAGRIGADIRRWAAKDLSCSA